VLRLRTLGALHALSDDGEALTGAAAQRRILALLALLAVAGDGGLSRDKIVGLLWPETDPERARHSLTQALYTARRALGADDLFVAGADVRLNRERIATDVAEFETALDSGELERAASIYGGPFLDGFYLSGSAEFEQWLFAQRTRLEARAGDAFERLAEAAQAAGDVRRVVDWRRRIAVLQPLDASAAAKLMTALANAGDRAGALQHARVHEMLLREQLDLGPDPVVAARAERLREPVAWTAEPAPEPEAEPVVVGASSDRAWVPATTTTH
jgi:serine/threonine-protein kinase